MSPDEERVSPDMADTFGEALAVSRSLQTQRRWEVACEAAEAARFMEMVRVDEADAARFEDEMSGDDEPLVCGIENPESCESCQ